MTLIESTDPVLHQKADPVAEVTDETRKLLDDMAALMLAKHGCGLAAPQVGISKRIIVVLTPHEGIFKMCNPEITWRSDASHISYERCLSFGHLGAISVPRHNAVGVSYLNEKGKKCLQRFDGMGAEAVQHEIDHLNGITIADYGLSE